MIIITYILISSMHFMRRIINETTLTLTKDQFAALYDIVKDAVDYMKVI